MKHALLLLAFLAGGLISKAQTQQIPIWNGGFEVWDHPKAFVYVPHNWTTLDSLIVGYSTAEESSDAHSGNAALKLMPLRGTDPNKFRGSTAILGRAQINPLTFEVEDFRSGQPMNYQPQAITGYYKYSPNVLTNDSAFVYFKCKTKNPPDPFTDAIAVYGYHTFQPSANYQKFSVPIQSISGNIPVDTLIIGIHYYSKDTNSVPSGYLLIDDLQTEGVLSTSNISNESKFKLYPNPTTDFFHIQNAEPNSTFEITDLAGKTLLKGQVQSDRISVDALSAGLYFLRVSTKKESWVEKLQIQR